MFDFAAYKALIEEYETAQAEARCSTQGRRRVSDALQRKIVMELPERYWQELPVYELAVCPLCGGTVKEIDSLPQIAEKIINLADPKGIRIMYQTLIDYASST